MRPPDYQQTSLVPRLFTSHGTVMFVDTQSGELRHGPLRDSPHNVVLVREGDRARLRSLDTNTQHDIVCLQDYSAAVNSEELRQHNAEITTGSVFTYVPKRADEFGLTNGEQFLCAEGDGRITLSRTVCEAWERFHTSTVRRLDGTICSNDIGGKPIHFFVVNKDDTIQKEHYRGRFYEMEELAIISDFFPRGGVFVDIGANVGNHTIYVCTYLYAAQVIVIEPNPKAIAILQINLALNGLSPMVDLSHLGVGLSDAVGNAVPVATHPDNLGGTKMQEAIDEGVPLIRGDDVLMERRIDFIKLDVEEMEMRVLTGLAGTISKWRPRMFVEVDDTNVEAFRSWLRANQYSTARRYRRYWANENYLIVPNEKQLVA